MRTVTSKDGTTIAFDQSGTGPALILVGGAFEQRAMPYVLEREIEDIAALINAAGGSAFVFGISSGAALANAIPNAQHRTLEGQTHEVAAAALAPVLVEFFKG